MKDLIIDFALPEEAIYLHELVKELAIYEKAEQDVKTQVQEFETGIQTGLFKTLVARLPTDGIVGMALYYPIFSTWNGSSLYLEDFIVKNSFRGLGIGAKLFEKWIEIGKKEGAKMLKWQVLDWNEPAKNFYSKYKTKFYPGWENGVIYLARD
ncbi:MAG: GNAT family N-acetyltransferase [Saprospiraceae bacterium]